MSIKLPDFIVPAGDSTEFLVEDKYVRGGLHIVADKAGLDTMDPTTLKKGMLTVTQDTNKIFQLKSIEKIEPPAPTDPSAPVEETKTVYTWEEFKGGGGGGIGVRQQVTHMTHGLLPGLPKTFSLPLGRCALLYNLEVDTSCKIEAFGTAAMDESNPYTFFATPDHLKDDGSTLMTDGTVLRGRRFSFLANMENAGDPTTDINIYFKVTNTDTVEKGVNLTIAFLPIESI
jgi:hypothetical protein